MSELRKKGLTTAVIASGPFVNLGKAQSKVFGVPDLPLVLIDHPLGGCSLVEVKRRAEQAIPQIMKLIEEHSA
jgi:hypothetical protein